MAYKINKMSINEAILISKWRYPEPYSIYSMDGGKEVVNELLDGSYYSVIDDDGNLIGYYCFGESAQVPIGRQFGAYEDLGITDIGLGIRPDMCGHGLGYDFIRNGMVFAQIQFGTKSFRLTVAAFNKRAIKVYEKAGFEKVKSFERKTSDSTIIFEVMIKK